MIIGIGNKARQGKDTLANCIKEAFPKDTYIVHWADALYDEVRNQERKYPLITLTECNGRYFYSLLDKKKPNYTYDVFEDTEVPYLDWIFTDREISEYKGMDGKDPEILQFWGTEFRRAQNKDYWVNKTLDLAFQHDKQIIVIPDTRFLNEYNAIRASGGIYIEVARFSNGGRYIDSARDENHVSETELDGFKSDFQIINDGSLTDYLIKCKTFIKNNLKR